nr:concanavalin A-like lectin/glucanase, subgroup [Tanacetum cinerariifolium]
MMIILIIILLLFPSYNIVLVVDGVCDPGDKESLLSFAASFSNNNLFSNWSGGVQDCCSWDGVLCDHVRDRVVGLSLPDRGLRGSIPVSLLNLGFLRFLDLSRNFLSGSLPEGFFERRRLFRRIDLSCNRLSGSCLQIELLPATLFSLNLSSNHFNGTIDARLPQSLMAFNVSNNTFSGGIPSALCVNSPDLVVLDFSLNDFMGSIPDGFGGCSKLEV